jgi:hypothetical protein
MKGFDCHNDEIAWAIRERRGDVGGNARHWHRTRTHGPADAYAGRAYALGGGWSCQKGDTLTRIRERSADQCTYRACSEN